MLIIEAKKGENIETLLKRFKTKIKKTKVIEQLRENTHFEKKSVSKRETKKNAIYIQQKYRNTED
jgi:small subunit ribosomal protein S21